MLYLAREIQRAWRCCKLRILCMFAQTTSTAKNKYCLFVRNADSTSTNSFQINISFALKKALKSNTLHYIRKLVLALAFWIQNVERDLRLWVSLPMSPQSPIEANGSGHHNIWPFLPACLSEGFWPYYVLAYNSHSHF